ncbi:urea amidolyase [Paracoccus sp. S-4012]|uniref:5-oxoprolinase subunit C family protein n=1 Tax=Paracoccus sp. S-4012 TaxID=2665648 RepID=UPI0012AFDF00|nr:biotin-dependent carboxyltransferase family protein [Paracoccus sp. S-4012]MRX49690.1 urea amidolyase [Paracoccus sp. S-4012]
MRVLEIRSVAGTVTVQDAGRPGFLAQGLSRGGAADPVALAEGAALLRQPAGSAAIELMSGALTAGVGQPTRIALTGAPMRATLTEGGETRPLAWHASHLLPAGAELSLKPGPEGGFGYLHLGGGIATPPVMGSRSAHLAGGVGGPLRAGDRLPLGVDKGGEVDLLLDPLPRFGGGRLRAVESLQTRLYGAEQIERLQRTPFRRDSHGNRMGVRLDLGGAEPFAAEGGLSIVSEIVQPGDIQVTGDGTPFVLMSECQTTGGYPRIATILPCDLPIVAQAAPGAELTIRLVDRETALQALRDAARALADLPRRLRPRVRDAGQIADLLAYNLVGGVVDAARPDHIEHPLHEDPP